MSKFGTIAKVAGISLVALLAAGCAKKTVPAPAPAVVNNTAPSAPAPARPAAPTIVPGSVQDFTQNVGDRVRFGYDRSDLDADAHTVLDKQAAWLSRYPGVTISVEGHCDERGTREYNIALGARRAASVKEYLVSKGVNSSRVETISYGKERPSCSESNETCWAQNRRGVSVITAGAAS